MSSIRSRLAKGSLWISVARVSMNGLQAISTIVLARLLAPADFGLVALATSLFAILSAFTDISLSQALVHTREPTREHFNTAWTLSVGRGLLIALGFAIAAPFVADAYSEPRLANILYFLALTSLIGSLNNPKLIVFTRELQFHQSFIMGVSAAIANVAISVAVAAIFKSYWALVVGMLGGQIVTLVLSYALCPYRPWFGVKHFKDLWQFSIWVSLGAIMNTLNYRFDQLLVGSFLGRVELGYYNVGSRLAILPGQELVRPLTSTLFPAFRLVADDRERLRSAYQRIQALVTAIALPASLGFSLIADPTVRVVLGPKWTGAIPIVEMIAMLYSIDTLGSLVAPLSMASGDTRTLFIRNIQKLAIRAPLLFAGIYFGGLMGIIYGRIVAGVIGVLVDMAMIKSLTDLTIVSQFRANTRCFVGCAAMAATALGVQLILPQAGHDPLQGSLIIAAVIVVAATTYVGVSGLLWLAAGKPNGAEREVLDAARGILRRIGNKRRTSGVVGE